ncbi:MAG: hypothetical protein HYV60_08440 [Planctomycetia bacterium]|nr:hypothetical protein [Planctomycetia bacterium]
MKQTQVRVETATLAHLKAGCPLISSLMLQLAKSSRKQRCPKSEGGNMSETPLEQRVVTLERQMQEVIKRIPLSSPQTVGPKNWRSSLGMFDGDPLMKEIDEEGERIRQADREKVSSDHS